MKAKVCVDCFALVPGMTGPRCGRCEKTVQRTRNESRPHYGPDYQQARDGIVAGAKRDKSTLCHLCASRTPPPGYTGKWTADHEDPADLGSRLLPAHLGCNSARGNRSVEEFRAGLLVKFPDWLL